MVCVGVTLCVNPWLARMCNYARTGLKDDQSAKSIGKFVGSGCCWQQFPAAMCIMYKMYILMKAATLLTWERVDYTPVVIIGSWFRLEEFQGNGFGCRE